MKILVLGASGMAGHVISAYFKENGHIVATLAAKHTLYSDTRLLDASNKKALIQELERTSYDVVINCIGVLVKESESQKDLAVNLNSYLPRLLERYFLDSTTKIIHISTDAVFSGEKSAYYEGSHFDSQTFYGRSKALGEINNSKDLTIRTSIIGPELAQNGKSLFDWFYKQEGEIQGYTNVYWSGVTTIELAKVIAVAISQNITGVYNLGQNTSISKFDLLCVLKEIFKKSSLSIKPIEGVGYNSKLVSKRNDFNYNTPSCSSMIKDMLDWIRNHQELYSHYI